MIDSESAIVLLYKRQISQLYLISFHLISNHSHARLTINGNSKGENKFSPKLGLSTENLFSHVFDSFTHDKHHKFRRNCIIIVNR